MKQPISILILAAGKGTRMNNPLIPKVLAKLNDKPLIGYVLETSQQIAPHSINLIVGYKKELVVEFVSSAGFGNVQFIEQLQQLGTGHAVAQAKSLYEGIDCGVLILSGDVPLLTIATLNKFISKHYEANSSLSVLSAIAPNPTGYGRIVRNDSGEFMQIVEEKDANDEIKRIDEINSGIYLVGSDILFKSLARVSNTNAQAEYYLTDIVEIIKSSGKQVTAFCQASFDEIQGINTISQLQMIQGNR